MFTLKQSKMKRGLVAFIKIQDDGSSNNKQPDYVQILNHIFTNLICFSPPNNRLNKGAVFKIYIQYWFVEGFMSMI